MPPSAVQTYEDLVCYEYAKLIAAAADMSGNYGFVMDRMQKLRAGDIEMSDMVREDRYTVEGGFDECISSRCKSSSVRPRDHARSTGTRLQRLLYCGAGEDLSWDHLVPTSEGGPDVISNQVPACRSCNSSKVSRDVIGWYRERDTSIPRIVWGKYLKPQYDRYETEGMLEEPLPEDERDKWSGLDVDRSGEFG